MRNLLRLIPVALLGALAAVLVSCGGSGKGLIPTQYAGPLQSDFQAVLQAAREGDGSCTATDTAIRKTEHDLRELPASVDGGLRGRLSEGVTNLSATAHQLCTEPLAQTTATTQTTSTTKTTPPSTGTTETQSTPTNQETATTPSEETAPEQTPPSGEGGGTQAPGLGGDEGRGNESEDSQGNGAGAGAGGATGGTGSGQ